jgi:hypothetical protein
MTNITDDENIIDLTKKSEALDFILSNSFRSGFGTLSKTELDLILFTAVSKYSGDKGDSEYELSKYLQITQQRIRNLKEKASVKYLAVNQKDAINKFIEKCEYAKIEDNYIDIPINDVSIKNEIEGMLDKAHILVHYQLNPKIFRMRVDDFFELTMLLEHSINPEVKMEDLEKKVVKAIKMKTKGHEKFKAILNEQGSDLAQLTKSTLKQALVKGGFSFGIDLLASAIPGGAFLAGPAKTLLEKVSSKI